MDSTGGRATERRARSGTRRRRTAATEVLVGGIDASRAGWVMVTTSVVPGGRSTVKTVHDLREIISLLEAGWMAAVGITVPIGLPQAGLRRCDVEAREVLGPRAPAVSPAPLRCTLGSGTFEEACGRSRAVSGLTMSKQTFANLLRIQMVDGLMAPAHQRYLVEVHPEVSFAALAGEPMAHSKTVAAGRQERIDALRPAFPDVAHHVRRRSRLVKPDDVLDAFAATWTARRWVTRRHLQLGGEVDERGLLMQIIA